MPEIVNLKILTFILGYGSSGTVVYMGSWNGRNVAVKRMLNHFYDVAQSEIDILIRSDEHPNILRYNTGGYHEFPALVALLTRDSWP